VTIDTGGAAFKLDSETLNEDVQTRKKPIRLLISLESPVKDGTITLSITPAAN
jgi:hypothetical protein